LRSDEFFGRRRGSGQSCHKGSTLTGLGEGERPFKVKRRRRYCQGVHLISTNNGKPRPPEREPSLARSGWAGTGHGRRIQRQPRKPRCCEPGRLALRWLYRDAHCQSRRKVFRR
jgi:hypothetical protein